MANSKESLFIKNIEFENFGAYYGHFNFNFSNDPKKSITIILGDNHAGKTTLHDLIHWGLYGEVKEKIVFETNQELEDIVDEGLMNTSVIKKLSKGESATTFVKIELHDSNGVKFELKRELTATLNRESTKKKFDELNNSKVPDGLDFEMNSSLRYRKNDKLERTTVKNVIESYIQDPFPYILRDHFLFDGELLDDFSKSKPQNLIQQGIEKITGLHILDFLSDNCKDFYLELQNEIGSTQLKAKPIQGLVEQARKDKKIKNEALEKLIKELSIKNNRYETVIKTLDRNDSTKIMKTTFKKLEESQKILRGGYTKNSINFKEDLFEKIPELLMRDTLLQFESICARLEEEDKFPPAFPRHAVDKILNSNPLKCVCGREFEKSDEKDTPYKILSELRERTVSEEITQGVPIGRSTVDLLLNKLNYKELSDKFAEFKKTRKELEEDIESNTIEIKKAESKLLKIDDAVMDALLEEKKLLRDKISLLDSEKQELEEDLENIEKDLRSNEKKLDNAIEKDAKHETEYNEIIIAKTISKLVKERREVLLDELRTEAIKYTSKYFLASAPGKETFSTVRITPNYSVHGVGLDGDLKKLSKGQGHTLGLSFISAMREITNLNTFLIIDSPLHNISGQFRNEISDVLCKYLPDVQLTLIMTDTEYLYGDDDNAPVNKIFRQSGRVWKEFEIKISKSEDGIETREIKEVERND